jgi:hypothetical protein
VRRRAPGWYRRHHNDEPPTSTSYLGPASTSIIPVTPAFDDQFWSTNNGNIYSVGASASGAGTQLWRIPYNGDLGGTAAGYANLSLPHGELVGQS